MNQKVLRVLDANLNRARESLRVVEDYLRFLEDSTLTAELKTLRHRLSSLQRRLESEFGLLQARNTPGDVGTLLTEELELLRTDEMEVLTASFKRLQEALRALEEYSKPLSAELSGEFKSLRYLSYSFESRFSRSRRSRLQTAGLCVLLTEAVAGRKIVEVARETLKGGADIIQLREKDKTDRELLELALRLSEFTASFDSLFIVNDRPDIAELSGADGVHIGQDDLPAERVRRILSAGKFVGVSTHSLHQARLAVRKGADYLGIGPVFRTSTKDAGEAIGPAGVEEVVRAVQVPAFAIGGITLENLPQLLEVGCRRVAVCSAIIARSDVRQATEAFKKLLE